jgi:hypothetical protein
MRMTPADTVVVVENAQLPHVGVVEPPPYHYGAGTQWASLNVALPIRTGDGDAGGQ